MKRSKSLLRHLIELRQRLLHCIISVGIVFLSLVYFSNEIYQWISAPLIKQFPMGASMIATDVTSPFMTPIKLTLMLSLFISVPFILYQIWAFLAPALYQHERRLVLPLMISSTCLFYIGMAFAYFLVFPLIFDFFIKSAPKSVLIAIDIHHYLDFVMTLFVAFGVCFEMPVAIILLCWSGVTTPNQLKKNRPYVFLSSFIIGMLLTPPDVFSQTLLAIPVYLLFEMGVLSATLYFSHAP